MPRSNKERTQQTRTDLMAAARQLFIDQGYADTSTPDIVAAAGVTRGALYHHFEDKRALFAAVVEAEAQAVAAQIDAASPAGPDLRAMLLQGGQTFIEAMQQSGRARLLLLDGPAVLGRAQMDDIDARHGGRTLLDGLTTAATQGALPADLPVAATAALLSAAFDRAALAIHSGGDPDDYNRVLSLMIDGLGAGVSAAGRG